jgi:hypothetical protein
VSRAPQDDEGVPAGFGPRLILTATPFVAAALVWWVLRWLGG